MDNLPQVIVGKDVIESLTLGMYEDARFIYREYIQNAADQIDKAITEGLITKEQADVHIHIDPQRRRIIIEDNATGVAQQAAPSILRNVAQSTKQRGVDKGFRGIGRLGGLAYCDTLIFETSYPGESTKTVLIWNAKQLKHIINDRDHRQEAAQVIDDITELSTVPERQDEHYFKVILEGVSNSTLLDEKEIRDYLTLVAPLPFPTKFILKSKIYEQLRQDKLTLDEYSIYLNGEQLFKAYSADVFRQDGKEKKKVGEFFDLIFFKEKDSAGTLLYWGWYGISDFQSKQLNAINRGRGIRLRKSNIQVGDEYTLNRLHREDRGNFYFIGEVHAFHADLIPNSRRDYFSETSAHMLFERKLKDLFHDVLHKLYYEASTITSAVRRLEEVKKVEQEYTEKQKVGFINRQEADDFADKITKKRQEAEQATKELTQLKNKLPDKPPVFQQLYDRAIRSTSDEESTTLTLPDPDEKPVFRTSKLSRLTKQEQKQLSKVFDVIRRVIVEPKLAENLIEKIEDEFR